MAFSLRRSAVLFCGATGSGKTSLIRMLNGGKKVSPSVLSNGPLDEEKSAASVVLYKPDSTSDSAASREIALVDTAGFLDNRTVESREQLFNDMLHSATVSHLAVKKVFLLLSGNERILRETIDWIVDLIHAMNNGGQNLVLVLTKVDDADEVPQYDGMIASLRDAFPSTTDVVTVGKNRLSAIQKQLQQLEDMDVIPFRAKVESSVSLKRRLQQLRPDEASSSFQKRDTQLRELNSDIDNLRSEIEVLRNRLTNMNCCARYCYARRRKVLLRCQIDLRELKLKKLEEAQHHCTQQRHADLERCQAALKLRHELTDRKALHDRLLRLVIL